jgi:hypothetical protein
VFDDALQNPQFVIISVEDFYVGISVLFIPSYFFFFLPQRNFSLPSSS